METKEFYCILCGNEVNNRVICDKCFDKLDLEKCSYDSLKQEYHLVWKSFMDRIKYPSILHDSDIMVLTERYKKAGRTIYDIPETLVLKDIVQELAERHFGAEFI